MKFKKQSHPQQFESPTTFVNLRKIEELNWEVQQVQLAVARRAYELFETRSSEHGHDWEDWFRAESELLRPVSISTSESKDRISVRANVFGFNENELKVSVEPCRITILGKKEMSSTESEGGKIEYIDWYPDQILKLIDLETDVMPESATIELQQGILKFELPKAAEHKDETEGAAA